MLESYALTDPGKVRTSNQDFYRIIPELGLYLLADGMGGARGGERASQLAVDSVADSMAKSSYRDAAALLSAVEDANRKVLEEASRDPKLEGMGTTLVAVLETDEHDLAIASVGDSRAYLCHAGRLRAVTEDQTWIQEVGRPLGLDEDILRTHPMRHVLTMAVGVGAAVRIRYYAQELAAKDIMMLSSDGLHGVAPVERMEEILADDTPLEQKCRALIEAAHEAGSPDNITVILLRPAN
ncbi:MAG TPA: protein phosphatase 2C domain-containing protein [Bryobacteraceae bacterium]|nr:protein phosphatase 2C domain-containing protein [Bryobacteraceae bacterium]